MRFSNADHVTEYGSVIWYLEPSTKNIVYAIDGEDNQEYYSFDAVRNGVLGSPEHLNHYDMWFTNAYPFMNVKGFIKLKAENEYSFDVKKDEIQEKFDKWKDKILAGRISTDGKRLTAFSSDTRKPYDDFKTLFNFFTSKNLILDNTEFYWNGNRQGMITELFPEINKIANRFVNADKNIEAAEDAAVVQLINTWKHGQGSEREQAGEQLLEKYQDLIYGCWYKTIKSLGLHPESPDAEDALSEARMEFLNDLLKFDETKGFKLSTYIQTSIEGILRNYFNTNRNKSESNEVNVPHHKTDVGEGESLSFDRMKSKEPGVDEYDNKEYIEKMINSLDPNLQGIIRSYFYEGKTLQEIGDETGYTKERIRQLIEKALESIRMNPETQMIRKIENLKIAMIFNE